MNKESSIYIGTSGWYYKHWRGNFYPENFTEKQYLEYYSEHFSTVEVNSSFYHLLSEASIESWIRTVPENFIFSVKASRYITHLKKLKEPEISIANFFENIKSFNNKIGPILFQSPPKFSFNEERLKSFLSVIPDGYRYVFEFRDTSWFNEKTYNILKNKNIAFCIYNLGNYQTPKVITSDFVYIRIHGSETLGGGKYSNEQLDVFAQDIMSFREQAEDVYCYFNNDEAGYAVQNARELKYKLGLS